MNQTTADRLHRINREFYRRRGEEFSVTRRRPWPGWARALEEYRARRRTPRPGGVLDLGCGNGRLSAFLAPALGADHLYLGVDASPPLLAEARRHPGRMPRSRFAVTDLLASSWPLAVDSLFTWVVAFGMLHHVAGSANRRRFMTRLGRRVAPGGMAAVSFWQFADHPRFRRRVVGWARDDRRRVEAGDFLLRWGDGDAVRYCHHVDDTEAGELAVASGLERVAVYRSDGEGGALNLYLLLARPASGEKPAPSD